MHSGRGTGTTQVVSGGFFLPPLLLLLLFLVCRPVWVLGSFVSQHSTCIQRYCSGASPSSIHVDTWYLSSIQAPNRQPEVPLYYLVSILVLPLMINKKKKTGAAWQAKRPTPLVERGGDGLIEDDDDAQQSIAPVQSCLYSYEYLLVQAQLGLG
ncbi:hypothetical protein V8C37DRAFT_54194 [Trichoderma ceciliae]